MALVVRAQYIFANEVPASHNPGRYWGLLLFGSLRPFANPSRLSRQKHQLDRKVREGSDAKFRKQDRVYYLNQYDLPDL